MFYLLFYVFLQYISLGPEQMKRAIVFGPYLWPISCGTRATLIIMYQLHKLDIDLKVFLTLSCAIHYSASLKRCSRLDVDNLPSDFIKISKNRNTINFGTADLLRLNDRAQEATKEIYVMTNV
jgi:hypothetical protein